MEEYQELGEGTNFKIAKGFNSQGGFNVQKGSEQLNTLQQEGNEQLENFQKQQEFIDPEEYLESPEEEDYVGDFDDDGGFEDMAGFSEPHQIGGLYALFEEVLNRKNSIKVSNVNKWELGDLGISVRECMRIHLIANTFHHPIFAHFFLNQGIITTDSAMSKEGWFPELFITSKKYAQKSSSSHIGIPQQQNKGWKMFSKPQENLNKQV